jgi:hypothetical protein
VGGYFTEVGGYFTEVGGYFTEVGYSPTKLVEASKVDGRPIPGDRRNARRQSRTWVEGRSSLGASTARTVAGVNMP